MLGKVLSGLDGAMLSAGASERKHQRSEATLYITRHMSISELIDRVEESQYFPIIFKETYHWFVYTRQLFVWLISPGVMRATAVEHVAAAVTGVVLWYALMKGEGEHLDHQRTLTVVF